MSNIKQVRALEDIQCINFCSIPQPKTPHGQFKKEITSWLKSLNLEQLKNVVSFTSSSLVKIILLMIHNNKQLGLHMYMLYPATTEDIDLVKQWSSAFYLRPVEVNFSSSLIVGDKAKKQEKIEILLNGIRISDSVEVYDTLSLSDDLLKHFHETLLILDTLTDNKIFETQWFDPCRQDFVTQYIIHGLENGIKERFNAQRQISMKQITNTEIFWLMHNSIESKEKVEVNQMIKFLKKITDNVLNEAQNNEYFQLFIKKLPENREEFVNEVLELFTDQGDINKALTVTIHNYDNLQYFIARKIIDHLYQAQRRPQQQQSQDSGKKKDKYRKKKMSKEIENVQELSKIFTSHNQSEVLPDSKAQKFKQGFLFSTPPNLVVDNFTVNQVESGYDENNSCPDYNHKTENSDSICEMMQLSHQIATKCIDEVLKKAYQEELEQLTLSKDKKKKNKVNQKKRMLADHSDKVSQVTSIDNMSSITALKTSIHQDDSESSQNWQGGSASQQEEIDFIDQSVFTKKQRRKLKLKLRKNQNQEKKLKKQESLIKVEDEPIQVDAIVELVVKEEAPHIETIVQTEQPSDDSFIEVESKKRVKRKKPHNKPNEYKSQATDSSFSPYSEKKYVTKKEQKNFTQIHKPQELIHKPQELIHKVQELMEPIKLLKSVSENLTIRDKERDNLEEQKQVELKKEISVPQTPPVERKGHHLKLRKKYETFSKVKIQRQIKDCTLLYKPEDEAYFEQITVDFFNQKMTDELRMFANHTRQQFEKFSIARDTVFKRIQSIVRAQFQHINIDSKMFGSSITGLALPDSDIDITILGFQIYPKYQLFQPMQELLEILSQYKWVVKHKHIYTAAVPILKLEIDPSIPFDSYTNPNPPINFIQKHPFNLNFDLSKTPSQVFKVDITFETMIPSMDYYPPFMQLAQSSTDQIRSFIRTYFGFSDLTIILKSLLRKKNLNDAYKGGISSYCLAVMLAAIYQEQNYITQGYANIGSFKILQQFLFKYGMDFDPSKWAVCLSELSGFIIQDDNPNNMSRLTVYSPLTNQVVSAGAVSAQEILEEFKSLHISLQEHQKKLQAQIRKHISPEKLKEISQERYHNKELPKQLPQDDEKPFFFSYLT